MRRLFGPVGAAEQPDRITRRLEHVSDRARSRRIGRDRHDPRTALRGVRRELGPKTPENVIEAGEILRTRTRLVGHVEERVAAPFAVDSERRHDRKTIRAAEPREAVKFGSETDRTLRGRAGRPQAVELGGDPVEPRRRSRPGTGSAGRAGPPPGVTRVQPGAS